MRSDWTLSWKNIRTERVVGRVGGFTAIPRAIAAAVMAGVNPAHGLNAVIAGPILAP